LFNTAYRVVKAGKPFSDYELICEIQVKNGLDLGENYRNVNGCKTFAASIAQTLVFNFNNDWPIGVSAKACEGPAAAWGSSSSLA
jgi:hypothetical protein